jgi:peptide/nickel transport system permease protein
MNVQPLSRVRRLRGSVTWILLRQNKRFWSSLAVIVTIVLLAVIGPFLTPYRPVDVVTPRLPPLSPGHPFGTDNLGYDVYSSTVYGLRVSLMVGLIAAIVATSIGTLLGLIAGYKGGLIDSVIDGVANLLLTLPTIFVMIIVGAFYLQSVAGRSPYQELINILFLGSIIGVLSWHWTTRAIRSQVLAIKVSEYIIVSKLSGNPDRRIIMRDILPNLASYILLVFVIQLANGLATAVTLEFLGIKASDWSLFARVNQWLQMGVLWAGVWWAWFIPGVIIVALIASLYLIVLSLDEVFNPRLRRV